MSKYTAQQVEETRRITPGIRGEMLDALVALLREREAAKAAVTDEMVCRADVAQREFFESTPFTGNSDRLTHESVRAALEAVAPMLASAWVPEGWQLVPVEPTVEMLDQGTDQHECEQGDSWYSSPSLSDRDCIAIYKAMLAAVPKPEKE